MEDIQNCFYKDLSLCSLWPERSRGGESLGGDATHVCVWYCAEIALLCYSIVTDVMCVAWISLSVSVPFLGFWTHVSWFSIVMWRKWFPVWKQWVWDGVRVEEGWGAVSGLLSVSDCTAALVLQPVDVQLWKAALSRRMAVGAGSPRRGGSSEACVLHLHWCRSNLSPPLLVFLSPLPPAHHLLILGDAPLLIFITSGLAWVGGGWLSWPEVCCCPLVAPWTLCSMTLADTTGCSCRGAGDTFQRRKKHKKLLAPAR